MQVRAESGKSALPICNYSQILYQFLTFTQNLKRSRFVLVCLILMFLYLNVPIFITDYFVFEITFLIPKHPSNCNKSQIVQ